MLSECHQIVLVYKFWSALIIKSTNNSNTYIACLYILSIVQLVQQYVLLHHSKKVIGSGPCWGAVKSPILIYYPALDKVIILVYSQNQTNMPIPVGPPPSCYRTPWVRCPMTLQATNLLHSVYSANTICKNYTSSLSMELQEVHSSFTVRIMS